MLRRRYDVCTSSNNMPLLASICPATRASKTPSSVNGVSVQPINRLSRFQVLCPWRTKQREYGVSVLMLLKERFSVIGGLAGEQPLLVPECTPRTWHEADDTATFVCTFASCKAFGTERWTALLTDDMGKDVGGNIVWIVSNSNSLFADHVNYILLYLCRSRYLAIRLHCKLPRQENERTWQISVDYCRACSDSFIALSEIRSGDAFS